MQSVKTSSPPSGSLKSVLSSLRETQRGNEEERAKEQGWRISAQPPLVPYKSALPSLKALLSGRMP